MKIYKQFQVRLESIQTSAKELNSSFSAEIIDITQEMLKTIKELEKQTRKTEKIVYKGRQRVMGGWEGASPVQEDTVAIGYLDIDGELIFNKINSDLFNSEYRFSRPFYVKKDSGFAPFYLKSLILEVVDHQSKDEFSVIGYVENDKVIYYDQIVE